MRSDRLVTIVAWRTARGEPGRRGLRQTSRMEACQIRILYLDAGRVHAQAGHRRLRIEYAVQVEGRRRRRGLTQHHMDLRSMVMSGSGRMR